MDLIDRLATTTGKWSSLDNDECVEGYRDGFQDAPQPGANRSDSYVHGWWVGQRDGGYRDQHWTDWRFIELWRQQPDHGRMEGADECRASSG